MSWLFGRFKPLDAGGDTIVEVMIVLAVLSLSLSISYATANKGLDQSRNAQEHSHALGLLDSQVELLRQDFYQQQGSNVPMDGTGFCMEGTTPSPDFPSGYPTATSAADNFSKYPAGCNQDTFYYVSIVYDTGNSDFDLRVRWDGLGNLGRQQEEITYLISSASLAGGSYTPSALVTPPPTMSITSPSDETVSSGTSIPVTAYVYGAPGGSTYGSCSIHVTDIGNSSKSYTQAGTFSLFIPNKCTATVDTSRTGTDSLQLSATADVTYSGNTVTAASNIVNITVSDWAEWSINGGSYASCADGQAAWGDGFDGCFRTGQSMYAWRQVNATYNFGDGTYTPNGSSIPSNQTEYLFITYNQYDNGSSLPPSGYSYNLKAIMTCSDGSTTTANISLPISSSRTSYDAVYSNATSITTCGATPSSLELDWTNNNGNDPNIQINQVQLGNTSAGFKSGSYFAYGNGYSACQDSTWPHSQVMCLTTGNSVYSYSGGTYGYPNFKITYPVIGNLTASGAGKYQLAINYSNFANNGAPPPPGYSYNINVYVNGVLAGGGSNVQLTDRFCGWRRTFAGWRYTCNHNHTITLTGISGQPVSISVEWTNDYYEFINGAYYDANFQLNSFTLTPQ